MRLQNVMQFMRKDGFTGLFLNEALPSDRGTDMMTPFPVPIHNLLQDICSAVIRTKEKPSLPVPVE